MLELLKFLVFVLVFLFLPGRLILTHVKNDFSKVETFFLSTASGIAVLAFLAYVLGFLRLGFLVFPLLLLADFYLVFFRRWRPSKIEIRRQDWLPISVVFLGALFQGILMFKSGTSYQGGLAFWGVHGYDAIWHTALIQELTNHFPPQNPGFAGEALKNYHFLTDLFYAQVHKITGISILNLYFRFGPLLFVLLLNSLIYFFVKRWLGKTTIACWAIFFASIAGSFGWTLQLFGKGSNNWETAFWGIQPTSAFLNPPFGVSLIFLVLGLIFFNLYLKEKSRSLMLLCAFVFGLLIGFKVYAGIIVLGGLGVIGGLQTCLPAGRVLRGKFDLILIFLGSLVLSLILYFLTSSGSMNYLQWQPWWFIKTMVEAPDRLNWPSLELRRQVYEMYNDWLSLLLLGTFTFLIFLFGNLGTRFIGFLSVIKRALKGQSLDRFLLVMMLIAFLPPIFFTQKVVLWNAIQFFYYFTFLFSFFAAEGTVWLLTKLRIKSVQVIFALLIIAAALPSTLKTIYWFNAPTPTTLLAKEEIEALDFLSENSNPEEIILTYPFDSTVAQNFKEPPVPMTYYNSSYVSFFTGQRVYLEDLNAATLLSYDVNTRLNKEKAFFSLQDPSQSKDFLTQNKIRFVYLVDNQWAKLKPEEIGLKKIFDNQKVRIYQVN